MKYIVHRHVGAQKLRGLIPKRYHSQVRWPEFEGAETALFLFRHDRENVVLSSVVRHALDSVGDLSERFRVAGGGGFTAEARTLLAGAGCRIYALSDLAWTDETYKKVKKAI